MVSHPYPQGAAVQAAMYVITLDLKQCTWRARANGGLRLSQVLSFVDGAAPLLRLMTCTATRPALSGPWPRWLAWGHGEGGRASGAAARVFWTLCAGPAMPCARC